jgi:hypothetical protein
MDVEADTVKIIVRQGLILIKVTAAAFSFITLDQSHHCHPKDYFVVHLGLNFVKVILSAPRNLFYF